MELGSRHSDHSWSCTLSFHWLLLLALLLLPPVGLILPPDEAPLPPLPGPELLQFGRFVTKKTNRKNEEMNRRTCNQSIDQLDGQPTVNGPINPINSLSKRQSSDESIQVATVLLTGSIAAQNAISTHAHHAVARGGKARRTTGRHQLAGATGRTTTATANAVPHGRGALVPLITADPAGSVGRLILPRLGAMAGRLLPHLRAGVGPGLPHGRILVHRGRRFGHGPRHLLLHFHLQKISKWHQSIKPSS